jgi:WD40 repeat protein
MLGAALAYGRGAGRAPAPPAIRAIARSEKFKFLMAGIRSGRVMVWRADTGKELPLSSPVVYRKHGLGLKIKPAALLPERARQIFDPQSESPNQLTPPSDVIGFSADGSYLAARVGVKDTLHVWELAEDGESLKEQSVPVGSATAFAFNPDTALLATAEGRAIRLWSLKPSLRQTKLIPILKEAHSIVFSRDGKTFAVKYMDRTAQVWETATGNRLGNEVNLYGTYQFGLARDGKTFLVRGEGWRILLKDSESGHMKVAADSLLPSSNNAGFRPRSVVAFSPDGEHVLATTSDGVARLMKINMDVPPARTIEGGGTIIRFASDSSGNIIATVTNNGILQLWSADALQPIGNPLAQSTGDAARRKATVDNSDSDSEQEDLLALSPNGKFVARAGADSMLKVWNTDTGEMFSHNLSSLPNYGAVGAYPIGIYFSNDGKLLAIFNSENKGWVVETATLNPLPGIDPNGSVAWFYFNYDGTYLVTGDQAFSGSSKQFSFLEVSKGIRIPVARNDLPSASIDFVNFMYNMLITCAGDTAQVWDATDGRLVSMMKEKKQNLSTAALSQDLNRAITVSNDGVMRLWDITKPDAVQLGNSVELNGEVKQIYCAVDHKTVLAVAGSWAYTFSIEGDSITYLASRQIPGIQNDPYSINEDAGISIRIISKITGSTLEVRDFVIDSSTGITPLEGTASALQEQNGQKVGLVINERGEVVPLNPSNSTRQPKGEEPESNRQTARPSPPAR